MEPLTHRQEHTVHTPMQRWSDEFAAKVVRQDFMAAEADRMRNCDWRWTTADEVYLAWGKQRYWEGTRIPRSNIPVYTAFEQIESMLPHIIQAIFANPDWFEADPLPGTSPQQARHAKWLMLAQLEDKRVNGPEQCRRALKSALIYGNGILEQGWIRKKNIVPVPDFYEIDEMGMTFHPLFGWVQQPTGRTRTHMRWLEKVEEENRPFLKYRPLKNFYIDKNSQSPVVQEARWAGLRDYVTVDYIDRLRDTPGFAGRVPTRDDLITLARYRVQAQADITMAAADFYRQKWWEPYTDGSVDPGARRIELFRYFTKERHVWMLNRNRVVYNEPNEYGFIPFHNAFYTDVSDRFYALAITDVVEGEQRLQKGIIDARVDELHLALHPHTIKKRGRSIPSYSLRRRPGGITDADDPVKDVVREQPQNITQDAHVEVAASENRVQKTTGGSDLALLGAPTLRGNSANRTATGVNRQANAVQTRINGVTGNFESLVLEAILYNQADMNTRLLRPDQALQILGPNNEQFDVDPRLVIPARLKFKVRAAAKARARMTLQVMFPFLAQTVLNPEWLSLLARQQQKVIDVEEFFNMVLDATVYSNRRSLFRDMTEQEQQAMNAPPPEESIRRQTQLDRIAGQERMNRERGMSQLANTALKELGALSDEDEEEALAGGAT
jgi:hypothetical protein